MGWNFDHFGESGPSPKSFVTAKDGDFPAFGNDISSCLELFLNVPS